MGFHTFDPANTERLEDPTRFRFCSREELLQYLPREQEATVVDVGSGTGYYTDEIAPFVGRVVGFDLQSEMHLQYRDRGVPENVELVTGEAGFLPFADGAVDGAFSTMTFHETSTNESAAELYRVLAPGAPLVVVDWSAAGDGRAGPPRAERYDASMARERLSGTGFDIDHATERTETFHLVARHPPNEDEQPRQD